MCGSRHTFSRTETKYFVGATEIPFNQLREIPGYRFAELFPHRRDGFTLKYGVKPVQIPDRDRIPVAQQKEDHLATLGHWKHRRVERGEMTEAQYAAEMAAAEKNWSPSSAFAYLVTNTTPPQAIDRVIKWERKEKQTMCGAKCRNARGPNCDCICEGKYHGAGMTNSRTRFAASDLDFKPTAEMAANAARGLELREKHGKGGTAVGVARARDIKNRANLSPDTVKRMHSFFSRHEGNQAGGEDDAGYIAWLLWGGDAGKAWAARKAAQIDKSESARGAARKATMARQMVGSKGNKRVYIDGPDGSGKYNLYFVQVANTGVPGESPAEDLIELKQFATEARARSAAQKMLSSRPGAKARFENYNGLSQWIARYGNDINDILNASVSAPRLFEIVRGTDPTQVRNTLHFLYQKMKKREIAAPSWFIRAIREANDSFLDGNDVDLFSRADVKARFDRMAVANEILRQLGGGRFMAMVGGKNALATTVNGKNGLQVQIGRGAKNGINRLVVLLDEGSDTYDMQLWRIGQRGLSTTKVWEGDGLYAEDLARIFTDKTGFYTSFARPGKSAFSLAAVKSAAAKVAAAYGTGEDSAVIRKHLDRIVSVLSGNSEGGRREAMGIHAQIGSVAERTHGRDFMWSAPMQGLESAIRSAGQFARPGAKARFSSIRDSLVAELRAFTARSLNAPRKNPDWHTPANTWLSRKKAQAAHDYWIGGDHAKSNELVEEASRAFDIVEQEFRTAYKAQPFSRPGAKARFATRSEAEALVQRYMDQGRISELYEVVRTTGYRDPVLERIRTNANISGQIAALAKNGVPVSKAIDDVLGSGTYAKLAGDVYDALRAKSSMSRSGAKAKFANWETNLTKKYGKPIEEHTAKIGRNSWKIEVAEAMDGSVVANLFLWNDNRGFEHFESGSLQGLRSLAERLSRSDAAGIAKINRIANYSRPGAKSTHAAEIVQKLSGGWVIEREGGILYLAKGNEAIPVPSVERALELHKASVEGRLARRSGGIMSRPGAKAHGLTLAQRIAVAHDAKRMALR